MSVSHAAGATALTRMSGGPDAFVIGIEDISQFEVAIHRKLVREIADLSTQTSLASYRPQVATVVDCSAVGQVPGR
jgi:hypothetical protein